MSGAGNDFILLDAEQAGRLDRAPAEWARRICRRRLSVGADGLLIVEPAGQGRVRVRFFNPDGSRAFCGNGSRCAARFANLRGFAGERMVLETDAGDVPAEVRGGDVRLLLPAPVDGGLLELDAAGEPLRGRLVEAGNPHYVVAVEDCAAAPLERWAPAVQRHERFGVEGVNFDLFNRSGEDSITLRTWERGVEGETLACGSGAVAAAFALRLQGGPQRLRVTPASGSPLTVELPGPPDAPRQAFLAGDARVIFDAELGPEATWVDSGD